MGRMKRTLLFVALCLAAAPLPAQDALAATAVTSGVEAGQTDPVAAWQAEPGAVIEATGVDLEAFEYVARPLVVFADSPEQPQFVEQMRLIESDVAALALRDVAIIVDTDPDARSDVRQALRPRGFGLVLMDKDGRVALRRPSPLTTREISRAIDGMPLRQEELRNRGAAPG